jgi:hypothetical protein
VINKKNYLEANKEISSLDFNFNKLEKIEDKIISDLFYQSKVIIRKYFKTKISLPTTQIPRGGKEDLNCGRHMNIFETHKIIPEFCFGCYKVLIEPQNVVDLIKLHFLLDSLNFDNENFRKCMIEGRKNVEGNYKGFIYCKTISEAEEILDKIFKQINIKINQNIKCEIKRGCSEYGENFPEYKNLKNNMMRYNTDWKKIENTFDKMNSISSNFSHTKSIWGLTLNDILIFENWIMFAKSIGDESYKNILIS